MGNKRVKSQFVEPTGTLQQARLMLYNFFSALSGALEGY